MKLNRRMLQLVACGIAIAFASCKFPKATVQKTKLKDDRTFALSKISEDPSYGLSPDNPVEVGGGYENGAKNERRYLNALAGPNGENISYYRAGSCCPVKSANGMFGMAMLDNYRVTWEGSTDTVSLYINLYDAGKLAAPVGFTIRK